MFVFKDYSLLLEKIREITAPYGENAIETNGMVTGRFEYKEAEFLYSVEQEEGYLRISVTLPFEIYGYSKVNFIDEIMEQVDADLAYIKLLESRLNDSLSPTSRRKITDCLDRLAFAHLVNSLYWDSVERDFDDLGIDFAFPYTTIDTVFLFDEGLFDDEEFAETFESFACMAKNTLDSYIAFSSESYCD